MVATASVQGGVCGNLSYSQSRGFSFVLSLDGAVISTRNGVNHRFYALDVTPRKLLSVMHSLYHEAVQ